MKTLWKEIWRNRYSLGISLTFVGVILLAGSLYQKSQKTEYSVLFLGDSIVGNVRDETSITARLEGLLEVPVYNGGFGGMTAAYRNKERRAAVQEDSLSLVGLAEALAYENFYWQNGSVGSVKSMDYFGDGVKGFQRIDIGKIETIMIEHGVNDYLTGIPLDHIEDKYDKYTFGGALRSVLELLQSRYPEKRIILLTPSFCWFPLEETDCSEKNTGYGILEDYVNLELQIAEEYGIDVLDSYHSGWIGSKGDSWENYTVDGLHLNEAGREVVAEKIAEYMNDGQ